MLYLLALAMAVVALLIWLFPMAIANKLVPRTHSTDIISMPARQVSALASATLGVWAIIEAIPFVAGTMRVALDPFVQFTPKELWYVAVSLAPMAIGAYLLKNPFCVADKVLPVRAAVPANVSHVDE